MQKFSVRKGIMLLCGWLPPATLSIDGFIVVFVVAAYNVRPGGAPGTLPLGLTCFAFSGVASPEIVWV
jgi:hypothetical protein